MSGMNWRPIATAPKDGTPLILFAREKTATASAPVIGWCIEGEWIECCFAPNQPVGLVPSHWMPRPKFPNEQGSSRWFREPTQADYHAGAA